MTGRILKIVSGPAVVLFAGLFLWQCSDNPVATSDRPVGRNIPTNRLIRSKKSVVESSNKFGIKLFREVNQQDGDGNIFISPLSVSMALGMAYNGASGNTRAAMAQTLELTGLSIQEANEIYQNMLVMLPELDPHVQMEIANSIWYRDTILPKEDFLDLCAEYFGALITGLDFNDPNAPGIINTWVAESTNGKIKEIVTAPIPFEAIMYLIDTICFKGTWKYQFDENSSFDWTFHPPDGSEIPCRMMAQKNLFMYYANDDLKILDLPYGDDIFRMTILLPQRHTDIDEIIAQLQPDNLIDLLDCLTCDDSVDVFIPKFRLEYELLLNDALTALGMGIAFDALRADFSNMYHFRGAWIEKAKHKTFVEINEEGTEAAGAASLVIWLGEGQPIFMANRPFVFMIREDEFQTILFIGKIVNPTAG